MRNDTPLSDLAWELRTLPRVDRRLPADSMGLSMGSV
jgi:hypothetical protein